MKNRPARNAIAALTMLLSLFSIVEIVQAQEVFEVGRSHLNPISRTFSRGLITWALTNTGTRTQGVTCAMVAFSNDHLLFDITDTGGSSGDTVCNLRLTFGALQNSYTFRDVSVSPFHCGNEPCASSVVRTNSRGSSAFNVLIRGSMTGVNPLVALGGPRKAIFRVKLNLLGPAVFSPFLREPKPDLVVTGITKRVTIGDPICRVNVTLSNMGDADWTTAQPKPYDPAGDRAVNVSLSRNGQTCGVERVTLNDFDPDRSLNQFPGSATQAWPECSFSGNVPTTFTASVDPDNRLIERREAESSKTVQLTCLPVIKRPR